MNKNTSQKIKKNQCKTLNIVMGSIRAGHFIGPLDSAGSSFYDLYNKLAKKWNNQTIDLGLKDSCYTLTFDYFNAVESDKKPRADLKILEKADVFLILVENEFQYANNEINPMYRQYLDERLEKIKAILKEKKPKIIILNSDIQHTPELIFNYTLKGANVNDWDWISENDFKGNIHTMKYYNLKNLEELKNNKAANKTIDFAYWGSYRKDSPIRQTILTRLKKEHPDITTYYLGHLPPFTDDKWTRKFVDKVPILKKVRTTLCFATEDNNDWLTAKYHEAMGLSIIPFVWKDYDSKHEFLGITSWQRVNSLESLVQKINSVKNNNEWSKKWQEISNNYKKKILSEDELFKLWESKVLQAAIF